MNEDSPDKATGGGHQDAGPSAAEESLSEALNGLEQILEHRKPAPREMQEPGGDGPDEQISDHTHGEPLEPGVEDAEACRKLAQRLANEIEVIVQARVETAVQEAAEDIREQIRNHLEIMLPELIDDLNALGRRQY